MTERYGVYTYCTKEELSAMTLKDLQKEMKVCEEFIIYEEMADRGYRFTEVRQLTNYYNMLKEHANVREAMQ